jgi:hypothetical protein
MTWLQTGDFFDHLLSFYHLQEWFTELRVTSLSVYSKYTAEDIDELPDKGTHRMRSGGTTCTSIYPCGVMVCHPPSTCMCSSTQKLLIF